MAPQCGEKRGHAYLKNGLELCELISPAHKPPYELCAALFSSHNSKAFPRYACLRFRAPPGGHRTNMTSITVSVQTGGSCAAGVVNHEPAGRS